MTTFAEELRTLVGNSPEFLVKQWFESIKPELKVHAAKGHYTMTLPIPCTLNWIAVDKVMEATGLTVKSKSHTAANGCSVTISWEK